MNFLKAAESGERRRVFIWEVTGTVFVIASGFILHFLYEWTGQSVLAAWFAPVNESVGEHLKLGFWGLVFFSLIEFWFIRHSVRNYFAAKALGILSLQLFVLMVFYTYTSFVDDPIAIVDILSYIVGTIICQALVFKMYFSRKLPNIVTAISVVFLVAHALFLIAFTFWPPDHPLFQEYAALSLSDSWPGLGGLKVA